MIILCIWCISRSTFVHIWIAVVLLWQVNRELPSIPTVGGHFHQWHWCSLCCWWMATSAERGNSNLGFYQKSSHSALLQQRHCGGSFAAAYFLASFCHHPTLSSNIRLGCESQKGQLFSYTYFILFLCHLDFAFFPNSFSYRGSYSRGEYSQNFWILGVCGGVSFDVICVF